MRVGIVGAGQLARMLLEAASALGIEVVLLAESDEDAAALSAPRVLLGAASDPEALAALAKEVDVVTFDHELVDLEALRALEDEGHVIRPSPAALLFAVDKAEMRSLCARERLPGARCLVLSPDQAFDLEGVIAELGLPLVIKTARGGYDGRGVFVIDDPAAATEVIERIQATGTAVVVEERASILRELACLVVRRPNGDMVTWEVVETAQLAGVCREVLVPGGFDEGLAEEASTLARRVAELIGLVGIMAVELFETIDGLAINELALRPHNSGHWTQDGSITSQFENHLRAVLDLPLGQTQRSAPAVAMVNVFGGPPDAPGPDELLAHALEVPGAHVHLYAKAPRPGRKLGHVTVTGDNVGEARRLAWQAASALGTPVPDEIGVTRP
jgi:5-(carboxyamino)imidazole ribonucleotide synthase